jgi:protein involved in polysaccharide export with SLBB domain
MRQFHSADHFDKCKMNVLSIRRGRRARVYWRNGGAVRYLFTIAVLFGMTGCGSEGSFRKDTHRVIEARQDSLIVRETVSLAPNTAPAMVPRKVNDYIIGPNDILYVSVNGNSEFGNMASRTYSTSSFASSVRGYRVDGRGCIYLPLVGKLEVAGLPLADVRELIDKSIRKYYREPSLVVEIAEYRTRQVFIFGAVKKPGAVLIPASGMNLAQLISLADTTNSTGKFRQVRIIRSNSPTEGELLVVDFEKVLRGKALPLELQEGDIVYIPRNGIASWNETIAALLPSLQAFSATLQPFVNIKYLKQ